MFRFSCERGARSTCKLCTLFLDDECEIKFFNRLIRVGKHRSGEIVLEKFLFFFCRRNTHMIASNGSRIDRIANSAHRVNISYRMDRRMVENVSFFMRKGRALDTVCKLFQRFRPLTIKRGIKFCNRFASTISRFIALILSKSIQNLLDLSRAWNVW